MKKTLKEELNRLFPNSGIETIHGEFYMRFELGGKGNKDKIKRIKQATVRGTEIYNQLIGEDEIIIVIEEWENDWLDPKNKNKNYLNKILASKNLKRIKGPFEQTYYEVDASGHKIEKTSEEKKECDLIIGRIKISTDQVNKIIKGIASHEMGKEPSIPQDVYFFSLKKQAGFRIYDDRGCDIWANSIKDLKPIYKDLNSWILDYNRPEIDKMFEMNMT